MLRLGHAFQIAKGCNISILRPSSSAALPDPAWGPQAAEQVLVEDLNDRRTRHLPPAVSFSLRVPDRETVAIDRRIPGTVAAGTRRRHPLCRPVAKYRSPILKLRQVLRARSIVFGNSPVNTDL